MELQQSAGYGSAGSHSALRRVVDEQQHGRDESRQPRSQLDGAFDAHAAGAGGVQHKADRVGAGVLMPHADNVIDGNHNNVGPKDGTAFGIVAGAVQGAQGKGADKCEMSVNGKVVESLFF